MTATQQHVWTVLLGVGSPLALAVFVGIGWLPDWRNTMTDTDDFWDVVVGGWIPRIALSVAAGLLWPIALLAVPGAILYGLAWVSGPDGAARAVRSFLARRRAARVRLQQERPPARADPFREPPPRCPTCGRPS